MSPTLDIVVDDLPPARRCLRVAVVTETYPPEVNGVALSVARVVDGLRARNHAVQLVRVQQHAGDVGHGGSAGEEVLLRGLPIPRYPHLRMGVPSTRALAALWMRQRPDVVHIATEGPLGWSALRAARRLRLPVVSDFRTNFDAYSAHYGLGWLHKPIVAYLRKFHNMTQCTMVPTDTLRRDLERRGFERVSVISRGVDTRAFSPDHRSSALRESWGAGPHTVVMLCVGRVAPEKNLVLLHEAWQAVRARGVDVLLVMVGDGPSRPELERLWVGAHFAGLRRGEDLARHYASADLFVFPSLTETYGNVVPEAMASGLALVAFDHAAAAELVQHGINGYKTPCSDPARFVDTACAAAADPRSREVLGRHARETALMHDWEQVVAELELLLLEAIVGQGPDSRRLVLRPVIG